MNREDFLGPNRHLLEAAGGVVIYGRAEVAVQPGTHLMAVRLAVEAGYFHPWHNHPEHESMGVVLEGRLEMEIESTKVQLGPGDTWHHPVGVYHSTRALEQTLAVEFHSPLRPDLVALLGTPPSAGDRSQRARGPG